MTTHLKGSSYVLTFGDVRPEVMRVVEAAAHMAGEPVLHDDEIGEERWMRDGRPPSAVVLDMRDPHAVRRAIDIRLAFVQSTVPVIGVSERVGDLVFEEAFAGGFDDVCGLGDGMLGRRLRRLVQVERFAMERSEEVVVVADPDRVTRMLIGRVFHDAGYGVVFATEPGDVIARSLAENVRVVVLSAGIEARGDDAGGVAARAARAGSQAAWIVNTPPRDIPAVRRRAAAFPHRRIAVHDAFASPATLLFVANELVNKRLVDARESERLLYGATVRFRHAGREAGDHGYLYNISAGGFYVRTLAPPERGDEVWLEFVPPRCDRRVHLEGVVAWARPYGPGRAATVPCGFGVKIEGGSPRDLGRYAQGYRAFLAERESTRESLRVTALEAAKPATQRSVTV